MHLSRLSLVNYRNFERSRLYFHEGVNTIIGENGAGKTNVFHAIRLLLDSSLPRSAGHLDSSDFHRGLGDWQGHWIVIGLEFSNLSEDEFAQALFRHGTAELDDHSLESKGTVALVFRPKLPWRSKLAALEAGDREGLTRLQEQITIWDYETILFGRNGIDLVEVADYARVVGDFEQVKFPQPEDEPDLGARLPPIFNLSREIALTFIRALRDVVSEFYSNRTNPLRALMKLRVGAEAPDSEELIRLAEQIKDLNLSIGQLDDVKTVTTGIKETIQEAVGHSYSPTSLSIRSELPSEPDRILQSLKLFIGEGNDGYEGGLHELSLGGANLIYLTLKLLEFRYRREDQRLLNILLIEEPEAHIHPHIQRTLFENIQYGDTQIIYSTHSAQISAVSHVGKMTILVKRATKCEAYSPAAGLNSQQVDTLDRYLDAIRSNVLFAKRVILVEGDAEEILIPIMVKKTLGISLDELGVSLINIRSTGFENLAQLFHPDRVRKPCAIITDSDTPHFNVAPDSDDEDVVVRKKGSAIRSQRLGVRRVKHLTKLTENNPWLSVHTAPHTFEVDIVDAGNADFVSTLVDDIYKEEQTRLQARSDLQSRDLSVCGSRALTMARAKGKGWFALALSKNVTGRTVIPDYILEALAAVAPSWSNETWIKALKHRIAVSKEYGNELEIAKPALSKLIKSRPNQDCAPSLLSACLSGLDEKDVTISLLARFL